MFAHTVQYQAEHEIVASGFKRGDTSLILARQGGLWVLGEKAIYPEGIVRLVGGGIDPDEEILLAAQREFAEELGVLLPIERFSPVVQVRASFTEYSTGKIFKHWTNVFFTELENDQELHPADDLTGLARLTDEQYLDLIDRFSSIPTDLIQKEVGFRWSDYGKYYALVHREARLLCGVAID